MESGHAEQAAAVSAASTVPHRTHYESGNPVYEYRKDQFVRLGFSNDIAGLLAERHWSEIDVHSARRLRKLGATPAEALRILW